MTGAPADGVPMGRSGSGEAGSRKRARSAAKGNKPARAVGRSRPFGRFLGRGGNYARTIGWAVRNTFAAEPRRFTLAMALGGLSLAAQGLAVLVVYGYSQEVRQEGGLVVPFLGIDWQARTDSAFLLVVVVAFAASLATAVLLNFFSQGLLLGIVMRRLARATEGLARAVKLLPDPRAPLASRLSAEYGFPRLNGGLASSMRSAFLIVQTIPALAGALLSGALLLRMEPLLTLILVAVTAVWSVLLYPVALRVVRLGRQFRGASGMMRRDHSLVPPAPTSWPPAEDFARSYTGWLRTQADVVVVVGIGIAAIMAIAIYVMGTEMMDGSQGWPAVIAYVGALQVALNGVFRTIRSAAIVSRRYTEIARNRRFVGDLHGLSGPTSVVRAGETIILGRDSEGDAITAAIGERLAFLSQEPMQRIQMIALQARDAVGNPVRSARWLGGVPGAGDGDAQILFLEARLFNQGDGLPRSLDGYLSDKLVFVVHFTKSTVGTFGESRLLLVEQDEIVGAATLGSKAAATALSRAAQRAARLRRIRVDQFVEDDDDVV